MPENGTPFAWMTTGLGVSLEIVEWHMRSKQLNSIHRKGLSFLLVVLFALFFFGGPNDQSSRHFIAFWNLGHILFFGLLAYQLFSRGKWLAGRFSAQALATLGICLVLGALVELLQYNFHRTPDVGDVLKDVIGGLVGIFFLLSSRRTLRKRILTAFQIITIGLVGLQVYPVLAALADEFLAREQFPVLSSFETPWEITRWRGSAGFAIDRSVHMDGKCSLRVQLGTGRYSGITLIYFPGNWQGAKGVRLNVYNPTDQMLPLTFWVQDQAHDKGRFRYTDRYSHPYSFPKGWTTIFVDVQHLCSDLNGRPMDTGHMEALGLFAKALPKPRVIYVDDVRLVF
jgi:VanZ family protein